jgi:hypothetical protein
MTKNDARSWLNLFSDMENRESCVHGHQDCSISHGGACLDDVIKLAIEPEEKE